MTNEQNIPNLDEMPDLYAIFNRRVSLLPGPRGAEPVEIRRDLFPVKIESIADALRKACVDGTTVYFSIYRGNESDSKVWRDERYGKFYTNIDRLITVADVIERRKELLERLHAKPEEERIDWDRRMIDSIPKEIEEFESIPDGTVAYIRVHERDILTTLDSNSQVYDRNGQKIWPINETETDYEAETLET